MQSSMRCGVLAAVLLVSVGTASAQWDTQTIILRPGWNAVFLEVQPQPNESVEVFKDIPIESVWMWNRRFTSVQYILDPNVLSPTQPEWLTFFDPSTPESALTNLHIIEGGRAYLINLSGDSAITWSILGTTTYRVIDWMGDSFNLSGFYLDPASQITFAEYFEASEAHIDQPIYSLSAEGRWELIADPAATVIGKGESYWIFSKGQSDFAGPLSIEYGLGNMVDFSAELQEQRILIRNGSFLPRTAAFRLISSEAPTDPDSPVLAGDVPLAYYAENTSGDGVNFEWIPFPPLLTVSLDPFEEVTLRLQVRRDDMVEFVPEPGDVPLYQSMLEIADGQGTRLRLPIVAKGMTDFSLSIGAGDGKILPTSLALRLGATPEEITPPHPFAGLWIGQVRLTSVSEPANLGDPVSPLPTPSEFAFRIIVHLDGLGQARLLQQVMIMFKEGTLIDDPDDTSFNPMQIVDEPGRFVLLTDDALIPQFTGSSLRDGESTARRISTVVFGFTEPIEMTTSSGGDFGQAGSSVTASIFMGYDDPLNPFKHKYHPDADNLDRQFERTFGADVESFDITRDVSLTFTAEDPDGIRLSGYGDSRVGGFYRESVTGIHQPGVSINVSGVFRLERVSKILILNDGL